VSISSSRKKAGKIYTLCTRTDLCNSATLRHSLHAIYSTKTSCTAQYLCRFTTAQTASNVRMNGTIILVKRCRTLSCTSTLNAKTSAPNIWHIVFARLEADASSCISTKPCRVLLTLPQLIRLQRTQARQRHVLDDFKRGKVSSSIYSMAARRSTSETPIIISSLRFSASREIEPQTLLAVFRRIFERDEESSADEDEELQSDEVNANEPASEDEAQSRWSCYYCREWNRTEDVICSRCRYLPHQEDEPATWVCPVCNLHNTGAHCNICGALSHGSGSAANFDMLSNMNGLFSLINMVRRPSVSGLQLMHSHIAEEYLTPVKTFVEPITTNAWNALKTIHYHRSICIEESACPICMDEYTNGDELLILSCCRRTSHVECLRVWFAEKHKCPFCNHAFEYERVEKKTTET
jgi:hypothetical protein